jgi:hypothetical protein
MQFKSTRQRPELERFWEKVQKDDACWTWIAGHTQAGYGMFHPRHGVSIYAHRYSWALVNGPVPDGLLVLHRCDTPPCVNPDHLFLGTDADNHRDKAAKGRAPAGTNTWHARMPERIARGEGHGNSRLTAADVLDIRARLVAGERVGEIARLYAISHSTISMIGSRKHWSHL